MEHQLQKLDTIFEPDTFFELHSIDIIISHSTFEGFPGKGHLMAFGDTRAWAGSSSMRTESHAIPLAFLGHYSGFP